MYGWKEIRKFLIIYWVMYGIIVIYNVYQGDKMSDVIISTLVGVFTSIIVIALGGWIAFSKIDTKLGNQLKVAIGKDSNLSNEHSNLESNLSNEHSNLSKEHSSMSYENKQLLEYAKIVHESNIRKEGIDLANNNVIKNLQEVIATVETKELNLNKYQQELISLNSKLDKQLSINGDLDHKITTLDLINGDLESELRELNISNENLSSELKNLEILYNNKLCEIEELKSDLISERKLNKELSFSKSHRSNYRDDFDMEL